jgi:hypothetical protein
VNLRLLLDRKARFEREQRRKAGHGGRSSGAERVTAGGRVQG